MAKKRCPERIARQRAGLISGPDNPYMTHDREDSRGRGRPQRRKHTPPHKRRWGKIILRGVVIVICVLTVGQMVLTRLGYIPDDMKGILVEVNAGVVTFFVIGVLIVVLLGISTKR